MKRYCAGETDIYYIKFVYAEPCCGELERFYNVYDITEGVRGIKGQIGREEIEQILRSLAPLEQRIIVTMVQEWEIDELIGEETEEEKTR